MPRSNAIALWALGFALLVAGFLLGGTLGMVLFLVGLALVGVCWFLDHPRLSRARAPDLVSRPVRDEYAESRYEHGGESGGDGGAWGGGGDAGGGVASPA